MFTIHKLSKPRREATRFPYSGLLFSFFELFGISFTFLGTKRIGEKVVAKFFEKTLSCLQLGAVWSEEKNQRKVSIRRRKVGKSKSDQEQKWK